MISLTFNGLVNFLLYNLLPFNGFRVKYPKIISIYLILNVSKIVILCQLKTIKSQKNVRSIARSHSTSWSRCCRSKPEVPNEHNEDVMSEVMQGLMGGLSNQANSQGGLGSLIGLLGGSAGNNSGSLMSNPIVSNIAQSVIGNLMEKFGLSNSAAAGVVGDMLPSVLGGLIDKTNDPNDNSIDLGSLLGGITGGKTSGIDFGSLLSQGSRCFGRWKIRHE